ncbi:MAG: ATP-binding protein [Lachnospiraceae bacterium]|nr:ATP-binding protein [Lachnospiraceae bacterium]
MIKLFVPQISEVAGYYATIVLRCVALLLLLVLYRKYAIVILHSLTESGKRWWNLALIALLFYLLQAVVSVLNARNAIPDVYLLLLFTAISFVMCAVYGIVFSNISYMKKDAEAALIRQNAEYLSGCLSVLQNAEEANRRLRHDMRHHIEAIAEYAKTDDTSAILAYIGEYRIAISEAAVKQYSLNRTVNSILSAYAGKAEENGIDFTARCNVPKELKVREIDIIALLGNLLENALYGCLVSGKEKLCIEMYVRLQNSSLVILCNNTCSDYLKLSGGLPTGKSIGISSILSVCRKYDGNLDYKIENGICSAYAVLNL